MGWLIDSPWRPVPSTGRKLTVTSGALATDAVSCTAHAVQVSIITGNALVAIGESASATEGMLVKTSDPPYILKCAPGEKVSAWGLAAATLYITDVTP